MALSHLPKSAGTTRTKGSGETLIQRSRALGAEEKAIFHNITGAGKSHVLREFMELNADDEDALTQIVEDGIDRLLAGEG